MSIQRILDFAVGATVAVALGRTATAQPQTLPEVQRTLAAASQSQTSFAQPEESASGGVHTLRVQKLRLPLRGVSEADAPHFVNVLAYNGRLVGPTIRARRGETLRIRVVNELPERESEPFAKVYTNLPEKNADGVAIPRRASDGRQIDAPHGLYTSNLHTHGLHVSPVGKADNVDVEIAPGQSRLYEYVIPKNHPAGTFWYHPHKHGSVAYQLSNGLAGAIIIEGDPIADFKDLESVPTIAAARSKVFVLQQLALRVDSKKHGWVYPDDAYNGEDNAPFAGPFDNKQEIKKVLTQDLYKPTTVNGVVMPTLEVNPGEVQRWRFVHAGREEVVALTWGDANGTVVTADKDSPMNVIAYDGLATGLCEKKAAIDLYPGYRCDILLKAPLTPGTYFLSAAAAAQPRPLRKANRPKLPTQYLAKVVVRGVLRDMAMPGPNDLTACRPFPKPFNASVVPAAGKRGIDFYLDDTNKIYTLNAKAFSEPNSALPNPPKLGDDEVWMLTVSSKASDGPDQHPFHIHVNPFVILSVTHADGSPLDPTAVNDRPWRDLIGRWKDTILLDSDHKVTVGMHFADWPGRSVMHCHIVDHEDQGMMKYFTILQANGQPLPEPLGHGLNRVDEPASPLDLKNARGERRDWTGDGRTKVLVFFRGLECDHCTRQLRDLVARVAADEKAIAVLAVTDRPLPPPADSLRALDVPAGMDFHLFEDRGAAAFRAYKCFDDAPQHGLFVIDARGRIRYRYVGDEPFDDPVQVLDRARGIIGGTVTR